LEGVTNLMARPSSASTVFRVGAMFKEQVLTQNLMAKYEYLSA
jgi:hypothetical protein